MFFAASEGRRTRATELPLKTRSSSQPNPPRQIEAGSIGEASGIFMPTFYADMGEAQYATS
jgi:hypothetical protein